MIFTSRRVGLWFDHRQVTEFRGADGGEAARMREQHRPGIADLVVEPDRPVHRLGLEVGGQLLDLQSHLSSFFLNWGSTG